MIGTINRYSDKVIAKLKSEVVFTSAFLLAVITSLVVIPKLEYINLKVLILLFNLMIVIRAFEELRIMDKIAIVIIKKYRNLRRVSIVLIGITFFASMVVTNDVALLTFVPLTLIIGKKAKTNFMKTIILQTLAANIGSGLTPLGNPQNLFLFTYYNINAEEFFIVMLPFAIIGMLWLCILNLRVTNNALKFKLGNIEVKDKNRLILYCSLFIMIILSVFNIVNYKAVFLIIILAVIMFNKELIKQVDYFLLGTFVCFFIFIGNLSNMPLIHNFMQLFLHSKVYTYFSAIFLSQIISNVPCAILLSGFTGNWREVLLGVNIGGMGTLIASLASVISYKLYTNEADNEKNQYLMKFSVYNFVSLIVFSIVNYIIFI